MAIVGTCPTPENKKDIKQQVEAQCDQYRRGHPVIYFEAPIQAKTHGDAGQKVLGKISQLAGTQVWQCLTA
jgi:hypothetical protein